MDSDSRHVINTSAHMDAKSELSQQKANLQILIDEQRRRAKQIVRQSLAVSNNKNHQQ